MALKSMLYRLAAALVVLLAVSGCENKPFAKDFNGTVHRDVIPWKRSQIVGLEITLEDKEVIEYMCFHKDGEISITLGTKSGGMCAPVYHWQLKSGCLFITDSRHEPYDEFSLVSLSRDALLVRRKNGYLSKFKVHPR